MNAAAMLKIVNPVLGILMVNQVLTGLLGDELPHEAFEVLHEGGGILLAVAVALHVALNWGWVRATFGRRNHGAKG